MYLTHITINFTVNIITYMRIIFVRCRCMRRICSNIANISNCNYGATKHDTREYSTPYVTERGFPTLGNAAIFMFIL